MKIIDLHDEISAFLDSLPNTYSDLILAGSVKKTLVTPR